MKMTCTFSLAEHFLGIYEDVRDNITDETSVFGEDGGKWCENP